MALFYAGGPREIEHGKPASAFSRGDLLMFNSGSSISQCDNLFVAGGIIAGVALSMSTESVADKVPYIVAKPDTRFWVQAAPDVAGAAQRGNVSDLSIMATDGWELVSSTKSAIALVRSESSTDASIVQRDTESNDSWVIISIVSTTLGVGVGAGAT
jgi:hypothetical protein